LSLKTRTTLNLQVLNLFVKIISQMLRFFCSWTPPFFEDRRGVLAYRRFLWVYEH